MNSALLKFYHKLPADVRSLPASMRGYYLRWLRYGPETEDFVAQALEREQWSKQQWENWRDENLSRLLHRAATKVPYYRNYWAEQRSRGNHASQDLIQNWPVLKKDMLRSNPFAFLAEDCKPARMYEEHTSGSTGKPLTLWFSISALRNWYALVEARLRRWNGVTRRTRWAILGGQLVAPFDQVRPPFWVWNAGLHQLYLSSYHLSPNNTWAYLGALRRHRIDYMLGYTSAMHALSQLAWETAVDVSPLRVAITNAEPVTPTQRDLIGRVFQCPVRETYGMAEMVCSASECAFGRLHAWPEAGIVRVMEDDRDIPVEPGQVGRLICTGLINQDMPLINYEVGDRGSILKTNQQCSCGRTLPALGSIEGRIDDTILTPDGRRIGRLDPIFKADFHIRESQIIQERTDQLRVRIVPGEGYTEKEGREIAERLRDRVGRARIIIERVDLIPRAANGKFRSVVSLLKNQPDPRSINKEG